MNEGQNNFLQRPPVVVVMGHVDHGKTTLLDYIRKTNVTAKEAGGITQSIGAYEIEHNGNKITFIDTPGHEAFFQMRSRGADIADLAILVVAADEGVKPQTSESIKIIQEAKIPFVVAITKTDKPGVDENKAKNDLMSAGVLLEGYGGQISYQAVSAKTGAGINELLDLILLAAEVENLTYNPEAPAGGFILETKMDPRRGLEVSLILKNGILKRGEEIFTATAKGKTKILENFLEENVEELSPSAPALVIGFETLPQIGEKFSASPMPSAEVPTVSAPKNEIKKETDELAETSQPEEEKKYLKIILKAEDSGSLEALAGIFNAIAAEKPLKVLDSSVGDVSDNDVKLAISGGAAVIAFKNKTNKSSEALARVNGVKIISSPIIYELIQKIEELLKLMENPEPSGILEILAVFGQNNSQKQVVGGKVTKGTIKNKNSFELERNGGIISAGKIINLQKQKKDAVEAKENEEAGLMVSANSLVKIGDKLIVK